jgi:hypothetical protein
MAALTDESHTLDHTIPLRITSAMRADMKTAAKRRHLHDLAALRLAAGIGFEVLKQLNYNIEEAIVLRYLGPRARAHRKRQKPAR